jgi:putative glycosyltransferase (TIGR04348 family)
VTPALADANNGNWQTARRWARMLARDYRVSLVDRWGGPGDSARAEASPTACDGRTAPAPEAALMIALHARRSAESVARWRERHPDRAAWPLVVALTGTDLYRDIATDSDAQRSLEMADALVTLNALGPETLAPALRQKCHVILQSCAARRPVRKPGDRLRALMVGHLRAEKDPRTYFAAARRLADRPDILLDHIGGALDPALGDEARTLAAAQPNYRWLGARAHGETRRRIQHAHLLVHPSRMEGGAHVVIEAIRSGTPVLASRIDGNLGLLGEDYPGVFIPGDADGLAAEIVRARDDPHRLGELRAACDARAADFAPHAEAAALRSLVADLLAARARAG